MLCSGSVLFNRRYAVIRQRLRECVTFLSRLHTSLRRTATKYRLVFLQLKSPNHSLLHLHLIHCLLSSLTLFLSLFNNPPTHLYSLSGISLFPLPSLFLFPDFSPSFSLLLSLPFSEFPLFSHNYGMPPSPGRSEQKRKASTVDESPFHSQDCNDGYLSIHTQTLH